MPAAAAVYISKERHLQQLQYEQPLVEEFDDVDAMIEAELEAQHALPGDLARKACPV